MFPIVLQHLHRKNLCHNLPRLKLYLGGLGDLGLGGSVLRFAGELNSDLWCGLFPCSSLSLTAKRMGKDPLTLRVSDVASDTVIQLRIIA